MKSKTNNYPSVPDSTFKGRIGERFVEIYFLAQKIHINSTSNQSDVGLDIDAEPTVHGKVLNRRFRVQVKFTKTSPKIKKETINYWANDPTPVFFILG